MSEEDKQAKKEDTQEEKRPAAEKAQSEQDRPEPKKSEVTSPKPSEEAKAQAPEKKPAPAQAPAQQQPAQVQAPGQKDAGQKKKKKINRLTLKQIEQRIQEAAQKMGGLHSAYLRQLLKRKEQLASEIKPAENAHGGKDDAS